jgi:hypothetical protein
MVHSFSGDRSGTSAPDVPLRSNDRRMIKANERVKFLMTSLLSVVAKFKPVSSPILTPHFSDNGSNRGTLRGPDCFEYLKGHFFGPSRGKDHNTAIYRLLHEAHFA